MMKDEIMYCDWCKLPINKSPYTKKVGRGNDKHYHAHEGVDCYDKMRITEAFKDIKLLGRND